MGEGSRIVARQRISTPAGNYEATLDALFGLAKRLEAAAAVGELPIGFGSPGALSKTSGLMKNCSSTCLNGKPLLADLEHRLGARVRLANDADCLALSEARDGAAAGADNVFAVILGTGVGGGIVVRGELLNGANAIAGERSEEHTSELQSLMRISYAVFCLKKTKNKETQRCTK